MSLPIRPSASTATASPETIARIRSAVSSGLAAMSPLPALSAPVRAWLVATSHSDDDTDLSAAVRAFAELPDDVDLDNEDTADTPATAIMHAPA